MYSWYSESKLKHRYTEVIPKQDIIELYINQGASMKDVASRLGFSVHKVQYWMDKYDIDRRSISDAVYLKNHPNGDPFTVKPIKTKADAELFGLGIGLYWGEGNKANKYSVRLGNTDPMLIVTFVNFLVKLFDVKKDDLKFSLQIFSDTPEDKALEFWLSHLNVRADQFYKTTATASNSIGTYRNKNQYGVVTLYYHNKRLRDILVGLLPR